MPVSVTSCRAAAAFLLPAFLGACSSLYAPRPTHRVSLIYDGVTPHLVRDQKEFSLGSVFSDGDAITAVADVPEAASAMRAFLARRRLGGVLLFVGSLAATAGAIYLLAAGDDASRPGGYGLLLGGTALSTGGLFVSTAGVARLFDAINLYNDAK